jgi:anti-sigma28 factor (negative regulator of flagellin synthesis)
LLSQISESEVTLNDLIAYIRNAHEEGKISPEGIANSLISKLEEAKKQLEKGKSKQAVNALNAFLNELSAQHQKHISDEVYGYLKEKVERLISRIESSG